ncbi:MULTISPECIES: helix-turn-helix domain-containing protein [unclassified Microbacterium]|uniref:helix-turn-helix domain-containing protein n=1 Tax=unclassified Microbacterium TaxID=2609290 RepID=UPI003138B8B2
MEKKVTHTWRLREVMASRGLFNISDLIPILVDYGIELSPSQLYRLLGGSPERINLTLLHTICEALDCELTDLSVRQVVATPTRLKNTGTHGRTNDPKRPRRARIHRPE